MYEPMPSQREAIRIPHPPPDYYPTGVINMREPDIQNLYDVLQRKVPRRPVLFELFMNLPLYERLAGRKSGPGNPMVNDYPLIIDAYKNGGYDYATVYGSGMFFPVAAHHAAQSISANDTVMITDWESFEAYPWPDPDAFDYSALQKITPSLPDGMKLAIMGPGGVLENLINLLGYENLCFLVYDEPELVEKTVDEIGKRLLRYYENSLNADSVGLLIGNDDWGFCSQTMMPPDFLRKYIFPWHKKIVEVAHRNHKPAVLHSCGRLHEVYDDIIDDIRYDGKHSYEDKIEPVEAAYERLHDRIAVMGGMDMHFMVTGTPEQIRARADAMLQKGMEKGGYALGTGNSVPEYIPQDHYFAMTAAALEYNG